MKKNNKTTKPDNNFYEKFFPEAWCTETGIKFVEPGAVGLWSRMLWEIMWWSPNRGALLHGNGMQMTCKDIAKFFGYNEADVERWIEQLLREKVASTLRNGTIINRRMYYYYLKDNYITEIRKDAALSRWDERYTMQNSKNTHAKLCKPVAIAIDIDSSLLRKGGVGERICKSTIPYQKIIDDLNEKARTTYSLNKSIHRLIYERYLDGFTEEHFKSVNSVMVKKWAKDKKMKDYLRPSTLYKEENFQSYLNQLECKFCSKRGHTAEIETDCPYYVSEQT